MANAIDLCVLADVKSYLGITVSTTDSILSLLITNASAFIASYCNRKFASQNYTETRNGSGGYRVYCNNSPVTAVSSVTVDGYAIPQALSPTMYGFTFDTSLIYIRQGIPNSGTPNTFQKGVQNITVAYTAGYVTTPPDLSMACIELVASKFAKRDRIDKKNETLGSQQTIGYDISDMPASVKTTLKQYQRWPF